MQNSQRHAAGSDPSMSESLLGNETDIETGSGIRLRQAPVVLGFPSDRDAATHHANGHREAASSPTPIRWPVDASRP